MTIGMRRSVRCSVGLAAGAALQIGMISPAQASDVDDYGTQCTPAGKIEAFIDKLGVRSYHPSNYDCDPANYSGSHYLDAGGMYYVVDVVTSGQAISIPTTRQVC